MQHRVVVGTGRDLQPVYINLDFVDGTRGAHVSISGISGVATKTSFALFLLHSLFASEVLGKRRTNAKALIFAVKGEDLMFLDKQNSHLDDDLRAQYSALGLPATPFQSVRMFAPPLPGDTTGRPNVTGRTSGVDAFWWTLQEFCQNELLPYVFADAEDERHQYTIVVHQVAARLKADASALSAQSGGISIDGATITTYPQLVDFIAERLQNDATRATWAGPATGVGTVNAFIRRRAVTRTEAEIRLTFPDRDARFGDVTFPVFQRDDGSLARVDPTTGATQGDLVDTTLGNAFGMTVNPNTATVDDMLLVADATMTARVDPATGEVVWRSEYGFPIKESLAAEGGILTGDGSQLYLLGSDTGEILDSWRPRLGFQMAGKADAVITVGLDDLARLDVP